MNMEDYRQHLPQITAAVRAIEDGSFESEMLLGLAGRADALGDLARAVTHLAHTIYARDPDLHSQLRDLDIEIDEAARARRVAAITDSDLFHRLQGIHRPPAGEVPAAGQGG